MVVACAGKMSALLMVLVAGVAIANVAAAEQPADQRRVADEQEMLAKARQEADERRKGRPRLEGTVSAGPASGSAAIGIDTNDRSAEALKREDELQRLSNKLRQANQLRAARVTSPAVETPWTTEVTRAFPDTDTPVAKAPLQPETRSALGHRMAATDAGRASKDERATVLLVMTPGRKGIRRFDKTADPILCSNDGCYVSNGPDTAARYISLHRSFGVLNTFGPRAGACRQSTGCVFRGVDVSAANAILQPVDLKVLVHDRRAMKSAQADETCRTDAGRLMCGKPIQGDDFIMWVVPESVAARAGSAALSLAVANGLSGTGLADTNRRAALRD